MKPPEPITSLDGLRLPNSLTLKVLTRPTNFREQLFFRAEVTASSKLNADKPVFTGTQSLGRPSENIVGWIDGTYYDELHFEDGSNRVLSNDGSDRELFSNLGKCVPPGGSLMVSYVLRSGGSQVHIETSQGLDLGFPPASTPLGFLLFIAGCGFTFKDWYFAEGGREGPEKLQGFKPLTEANARVRGQVLVKELEAFLRQEPQTGALCESARERARNALTMLRQGRPKF